MQNGRRPHDEGGVERVGSGLPLSWDFLVSQYYFCFLEEKCVDVCGLNDMEWGSLSLSGSLSLIKLLVLSLVFSTDRILE